MLLGANGCECNGIHVDSYVTLHFSDHSKCVDEWFLVHTCVHVLCDLECSEYSLTSIIIDGMALVQKMVVHKTQIKTSKDLLECYVHTIDNKSAGYIDAYVVIFFVVCNIWQLQHQKFTKRQHQRASFQGI